jgi:DNA-binding transcriptional regulator LsrR (DeoR family)
MMTVKIDKSRLENIASRWNNGESQTNIARDLGITKQRVKQLLEKCPKYDIHVKSRIDIMAEALTGGG